MSEDAKGKFDSLEFQGDVVEGVYVPKDKDDFLRMINEAYDMAARTVLNNLIEAHQKGTAGISPDDPERIRTLAVYSIAWTIGTIAFGSGTLFVHPPGVQFDILMKSRAIGAMVTEALKNKGLMNWEKIQSQYNQNKNDEGN